MRWNPHRGFTLIELLVVISIIGLLSSFVMAGLDVARAKARDTVRISDIRQINTAIQLYIASNNHAPFINNQTGAINDAAGCSYLASSDTCDTSANCISSKSQCVNGVWLGWKALGTALSPYMSKLPFDPKPLVAGSAIEPGSARNYAYLGPAALKNQCDNNTGGCIGSASPTSDNDYVVVATGFESKSAGWGLFGGVSIFTTFGSTSI